MASVARHGNVIFSAIFVHISALNLEDGISLLQDEILRYVHRHTLRTTERAYPCDPRSLLVQRSR
jgi:hypothetical protein